jgi:hypothetical protein
MVSEYAEDKQEQPNTDGYGQNHDHRAIETQYCSLELGAYMLG